MNYHQSTLQWINGRLIRGDRPTIREIMKGTKATSTSVVNYRVNRLIELGFLKKIPRIPRGLSLGQKNPLFRRHRRVPRKWLNRRLQVGPHSVFRKREKERLSKAHEK